MKVQEIKQLSEASLSRTYRLLLEHDGGIITANRSARLCGEGAPYTAQDNRKRNNALAYQLNNLGYGVTRAKGSYIENYGSEDAVEVSEEVFIVIDIRDRGDLKNQLVRLGQRFDQDSVLYIPRPGDMGFLIGTSDCPNAYPGPGNTIKLQNPVFGKGGEFFTRVKGRPFTLEEGIQYYPPASGFFGKWGMYLASRKNWQDLPDNNDDSVLD